MNKDISSELVDQVSAAKSTLQPLNIVGGGSKEFLGRVSEGQPLHMREHCGIVDYSPSELVMTARAGTPLVDLIDLLDQHHQMLAFEPPLYNGQATLGGTLATNSSGPSRPWRGAVRDSVLGIRLINGEGQHLRFGGVVMKNVAGYDLSRFQAGAMGSLGVITEVSFKVLPKPATEKTLTFELSQADAIQKLTQWQKQPKPISAAVWVDGVLSIRLSGAQRAVDGTSRQWGGELMDEKEATLFWESIREQTHRFFHDSRPLWRFSVKSSLAATGDDAMVDWGGAIRWVRREASLPNMVQQAIPMEGQVSLYRNGDREAEVFAPLPTPMKQLHQQIKRAMDPYGIFNPGRLYSWL
ncbi:glycolate oxidase subunit GlcE [Hahella sp. CCB-MM4]|uniref:glycolate oxidase subunit GlcE n=1 Tax=Hahella sp. (strain CCB-MM4) TaxID=1926491 RepID=UPI000B9AA49D|nr:glycolate oxidase subunit GlcE [Hahella sp. CCB-MM4]OZG71929.1 glycolate oxidase subunit GlcE [Hahella sp. CCB-MM4]